MSSRRKRAAFRSQKRKDRKLVRAAKSDVLRLAAKGDQNQMQSTLQEVGRLCLKYGWRSPIQWRRA